MKPSGRQIICLIYNITIIYGVSQPRPQGFSLKKWTGRPTYFLREKPWGRGWELASFNWSWLEVLVILYQKTILHTLSYQEPIGSWSYLYVHCMNNGTLTSTPGLFPSRADYPLLETSVTKTIILTDFLIKPFSRMNSMLTLFFNLGSNIFSL